MNESFLYHLDLSGASPFEHEVCRQISMYLQTIESRQSDYHQGWLYVQRGQYKKFRQHIRHWAPEDFFTGSYPFFNYSRTRLDTSSNIGIHAIRSGSLGCLEVILEALEPYDLGTALLEGARVHCHTFFPFLVAGVHEGHSSSHIQSLHLQSLMALSQKQWNYFNPENHGWVQSIRYRWPHLEQALRPLIDWSRSFLNPNQTSTSLKSFSDSHDLVQSSNRWFLPHEHDGYDALSLIRMFHHPSPPSSQSQSPVFPLWLLAWNALASPSFDRQALVLNTLEEWKKTHPSLRQTLDLTWWKKTISSGFWLRDNSLAQPEHIELMADALQRDFLKHSSQSLVQDHRFNTSNTTSGSSKSSLDAIALWEAWLTLNPQVASSLLDLLLTDSRYASLSDVIINGDFMGWSSWSIFMHQHRFSMAQKVFRDHLFDWKATPEGGFYPLESVGLGHFLLQSHPSTSDLPPLSQRDVSRYLSQWSSLFSLSDPWSHEARNDVWWTHAQGYQAHWERQQLSMTLHPCGSHTSSSRNTKKL